MQVEKPRCLVCELEEGYSPTEIEREVISQHEFDMIEINDKYFCATTLERCEDQETWEEMPEEESKIAEREYLVKVKGKYIIMLKDLPKK